MNEDNISGQGRIHLTLREDDGKETYFTIKRTTPMMLVFAAFCTKKNLQPRSYRFVLDGGRVIGNSDTADSLELENKCLISVCLSNPSFPPTPPPPHAALADSSVESANLPVTIKVISDDAEILFKIKRVSSSFPTPPSPTPPSSPTPSSSYLSPTNPIFFHFSYHSPLPCGESSQPLTQKWDRNLDFIVSCSMAKSCLRTKQLIRGDWLTIAWSMR